MFCLTMRSFVESTGNEPSTEMPCYATLLNIFPVAVLLTTLSAFG
jgi:hypothetical protein